MLLLPGEISRVGFAIVIADFKTHTSKITKALCLGLDIAMHLPLKSPYRCRQLV